MASSIKMESMIVDGENVFVDLNDILDILPSNKKMHYIIIFKDGDIWYDIKLKKSIFNKFEKIKSKRGQI